MRKLFLVALLVNLSYNLALNAQNYAYIAKNVLGSNSNVEFELIKYNITTCAATSLGIVDSDIHQDFALNPKDGQLYFIGNGYYLSRLNPATLKVERLRNYIDTTHTKIEIQYWQFNALEFDSLGYLYLTKYDKIYRVDVFNNYEMELYHDFNTSSLDITGLAFIDEKIYIKGKNQTLFEVDTRNWNLKNINKGYQWWFNFSSGLTYACQNKLYSNDNVFIMETDLSNPMYISKKVCKTDFIIYGIAGFYEHKAQFPISETEISINGDKTKQLFDFCIDQNINIKGNTPNTSNFEKNEWKTISKGESISINGNNLEINNIKPKKEGRDTIVYRFVSERDGCVSTDTAIFDIKDYPKKELIGDDFICDNQNTSITLLDHDINTTIKWLWNGNAIGENTNTLLNLKKEGVYWAELGNKVCPVTTTDSFNLKVHALTPALARSNSFTNAFCIDETVSLIGSNPNSTKGEKSIWKSLSNTAFITLENPNQTTSKTSTTKADSYSFEYSIVLESENCFKRDTLSINFVDYPNIELVGEAAICENKDARFTFTTDQNKVSYNWYKDNIILSNRRDNPQLFNQEGWYKVGLKNAVCPEKFSQELFLQVDSMPKGKIVLNGKENLETFEGDLVEIETSDITTNNSWSISTNNFLFEDNTIKQKWDSENNYGKNIIYLNNKNGLCTQSDTAILFVKAKLKAPNIFTANGDGINETFKIRGIETYTDAKVSIFNRWGTLIYSSKNYSAEEWNGLNHAEGVYYYLIETELQNKTGVVHLLR